MGRIDFERPIPTGETVLVNAWVYDTGETSVHVRLKTFREDPRSGETELAAHSVATYVAIDENQDSVPVPTLVVETEKGQRLVEEAENASSERDQ